MNFGLLSTSPGIPREYWIDAGRFDRVEMEIGPGNCGYLLAAAARAPRTHYVGIEAQESPLKRVRAARLLPANLRLIDGDGGWIVRNLLAPRSIDAFHVYFPDPWWKKRHHKRRIFQPEFCQAARRALTPEGSLFVVSDVVPLFAEIRERMEEAGFAATPWERDESDPACGAYESKYRRQGRQFEQARFQFAG